MFAVRRLFFLKWLSCSAWDATSVDPRRSANVKYFGFFPANLSDVHASAARAREPSLSLSRSVARASQKPCTATLMLACTNFHFPVVSRSFPPLRGETDMRTSRQTHSLEQTRNLQISVVSRTTFRWLTAKKMSVRMMFVSNWHETDRSAPCQLGSRSHSGSLSCLNARSVHWFLPTCLLAVLKILLSCTFQDRHSLWTRGPARRGFSRARSGFVSKCAGGDATSARFVWHAPPWTITSFLHVCSTG